MGIVKVRNSGLVEWYEYVREAEDISHCAVDEDLESYLVYLLLRFMDQPELADQALGSAYLTALSHPTMGRSMMLRNVGDQCLLFSGLYPERATHRSVRVGYFVDIGKRSYLAAGEELRHEINLSKLYNRLCLNFVALMDVLQSMRNLGVEDQRISIEKAMEIWEDTGSAFARKLILESP